MSGALSTPLTRATPPTPESPSTSSTALPKPTVSTSTSISSVATSSASAPADVVSSPVPPATVAHDDAPSTKIPRSKKWQWFTHTWQVCATLIATVTTLMVIFYTVRTYNLGVWTYDLAAWTANKDYCEFQRSFENVTTASQCSVGRPPVKASYTKRWEQASKTVWGKPKRLVYPVVIQLAKIVLACLRSISFWVFGRFVKPLTLAITVGANHFYQNLDWIFFMFISYTFLTFVYNLSFHPLAKYPGPLLWRISPFPSIISLLRGRIPFDYKVLHDKYGPVVRVMPSELSFSTAGAWEDIYGYRSRVHRMEKDPIQVETLDVVHGEHVPNVALALGADHLRQRRALSHAFSHAAFREQEPILQSSVSLFVQKLKIIAHNGNSVDMATWFSFCTLDIIGNLSLGMTFGCIQGSEGSDAADWAILILETIKSGVIEEATRRFAKPNSLFQRFLLWCISGAIRERRSRHVRNITEKVIYRIYSGSKHRDFIWSLLKHRESVWSFLKQRRNSRDMSDNEIAMNTAHFIVKGSETTATALCGLTNHILRSPSIYKRLIDEIRGACGSETDVNHTVLKDLPYLNACIEEGLRIFPPIPIGLLRTVPKGGALINGHAVPGGTSVSVASWATAHSPDNFADPDSFLPERYLDTSGYGNDVRAAAQPFSRGIRGCLGRNLAYAELRLILGSLLWHFDVEFSDTAESWNPKNQFEGLRVYNTWEKKPLMVQLTDVRKTHA